jgi:hypothetical protein
MYAALKPYTNGTPTSRRAELSIPLI